MNPNETVNDSYQDPADLMKNAELLYEKSNNNSFEDPNECIECLKDIIHKQNNLIKQLHDKLKSNCTVETKENYTQTEKLKEIATGNLDNVWDPELNIQEAVKAVAENALGCTSFIYNSSSGLYYDCCSGYYYDAERGLYYDGYSGIYYSYNVESNKFDFHSKVAISSSASTSTNNVDQMDIESAIKSENINECEEEIKPTGPQEYEEGECSESDNELIDNIAEESKEPSDIPENTQQQCVIIKDPVIDESVKIWPPCMRIIVENTLSKSLDPGTLFIVTYKGGTVGRLGEKHAVLIPDKNISKCHAKFYFKIEDKTQEKGDYFITDLGSKNGTFLNGKRLSMEMRKSEPHMVSHNSTIKVGDTLLTCHIHLGLETCDDCEPGLLMNKGDTRYVPQTSQKSLSADHRDKLKAIKKKFGLQHSDNELFLRASIPLAGYEDKAEVRRQNVGSSSDSFKTEVTSVNESISSENRGYKLLAKMGWKGEGSTIFEKNIQTSILASKTDKSGLGYEKSPLGNVKIDPAFRKKQEIWRKTRKRFKEISK